MPASATVDTSKRARRGPDPLPEGEAREWTVSVRLNGDELAQLDAQRAPVRMKRGEYLRAAALHQLPPTIPPLNADAWVELSRSAANLNQLARRANAGDLVDMRELAACLAAFRAALIGADRSDRSGGE
jgi:hypothetical protein